MNINPQKFKYFKRFINNDGSVKVEGYNSITGKRVIVQPVEDS